MQTKALNFILEESRNDNIEALSQEYLNMIAILYGDKIERGDKAVRDYGKMTMVDIIAELEIRTMMYHGQRMRRKKDLRKQHADAERELLEELKRSGM